jgi:hypothetical protein
VHAVVTPDTRAEFSWWMASTIASADLSRAEVADSPVRVGFAFDGDVSRLSMRNRMQFQPVEALTGEAPPFAMLMYVWDNHAEFGSVLPSTRSDRLQKIVLEKGETRLLPTQPVQRLRARVWRAARPPDRDGIDDRHRQHR